MLKIDNQKNYYIQEVEKAYQEGYRFYINGGGSGACLIYKKVFLGEGRKIPLEAFVVNDSYYDMILGMVGINKDGQKSFAKYTSQDFNIIDKEYSNSTDVLLTNFPNAKLEFITTKRSP